MKRRRASTAYLDIWDVGSFDRDLLTLLEDQRDLIYRYWSVEQSSFESHDMAKGIHRPRIRPANPFRVSFSSFSESLIEAMQARTVRAWHYTRLVDAELALMERDGIRLSTLDSLRQRLDAVVAAGGFSLKVADEVFAKSLLHGEEGLGRVQMFWAATNPVPIDEDEVVPLLSHWGGEAATMRTNQVVLSDLASVGRGRVVELAVPLSKTQDADRAVDAVLSAYGRSIGCHVSTSGLDVCVVESLAGNSILAVHSQGDGTFERIGRGYPKAYIDAH